MREGRKRVGWSTTATGGVRTFAEIRSLTQEIQLRLYQTLLPFHSSPNPPKYNPQKNHNPQPTEPDTAIITATLVYYCFTSATSQRLIIIYSTLTCVSHLDSKGLLATGPHEVTISGCRFDADPRPFQATQRHRPPHTITIRGSTGSGTAQSHHGETRTTTLTFNAHRRP